MATSNATFSVKSLYWINDFRRRSKPSNDNVASPKESNVPDESSWVDLYSLICTNHIIIIIVFQIKYIKYVYTQAWLLMKHGKDTLVFIKEVWHPLIVREISRKLPRVDSVVNET